MAFPTLGTAATTETTLGTTSHDLNLPGSITSGRLLIAVLQGADQASAINGGMTGWTQIDLVTSTGWRAIYAKIATGSEGSTVNVTTSAGTRIASVIFEAAGWYGTIATGLEFARVDYAGTTSQPRSGVALNPTNWDVEDTRWLSIYACDSSDTLTSAPTGYSEVGFVSSGNTNSSHLYVYTRTNAAASETPDSWTLGSQRAGSSYTVGIRPAAAGLTTKLKVMVHESAASDTGIQGAVFEAPTGGAVCGAKIGEFTGAAFEASLESGQAVLKVAVTEFGGGALTTSDTPVAIVRNTNDTTGMVNCTVIEE